MMFALDERRRANAKDRLETMHSIMEMWGPDKMPQGLLNEYGSSLDTLAGGKVVPRDLQGNVLPPEPSIQQEGRKRLAQMSPQDRNTFFDRMLGMKPTAAEEARLEELKMRDKKEGHHWDTMESIAWANADRKRPADTPSQWTMGPDGRPRRAEPGDRVMTKQDIINWERVNKTAIAQDDANMKRKKLRREIEEDRTTGKMLTSTIIGISKLKDNDPNKVLLFNSFWERWRKYNVDHGLPDPGPPQQKKNWMNAMLSQAHDMLTSAIGPDSTYKAGKLSGPVADPPTMSPEEELRRFEEQNAP